MVQSWHNIDMLLNCIVCYKEKDVRPYRKSTFRYCSTRCKHKDMENKTPWNKGITYTVEQKKRLNLTGLSLGRKHNEENQNWKGEFASYSALHYWIYRRLGKASYCTFDISHISTRYHWANISKEYRRDIKDFMSLCPSCHYYYDKKQFP